MRLAFGLDSFLNCTLCDIAAIKSVDDAVDIFYCAVGYLRSCHLELDYDLKAPQFIEFTTGLLRNCLNVEDFDADQFVWLLESIREHFCLSSASFRSVCESVLGLISSGKIAQTGLDLLNAVSIISTSPSLQQFSILAETVNLVFQQVVDEITRFLNRFIFGSFIEISWDGEGDPEPPDQISTPLRLWKLYLTNIAEKVREHPALPDVLIVAFLDESLVFLSNYYGEVQATRTYSVKLRMDLLELIAVCAQYYPGNMDHAIKKKLWYLLYVVAISGCEDGNLVGVKPKECREKDEVYLGLKFTDRDLCDYPEALARLSAKFASEAEVFEPMTKFIRTNYSN